MNKVILTAKEVALVEEMLELFEAQNEGLLTISKAASIRCLRAKISLFKGESQTTGLVRTPPEATS